MQFDKIIKINDQELTKKYIQSLNKEERLALVEPIFNILRETGWIYPDDIAKVKKSWKALNDYVPDLTTNELFNNSSLATDICKYFCHKFYLATEQGKPTMIDNFNDDEILKKIIGNRLGLDWLESDDKGPGVNEAFSMTQKMIVFQGQRSMRLVNATSIFKPSIAKYLYMKYSQEGDTVYDYSAGFGGRMMGAACCNRKYIGVDPWTTDELEVMAKELEMKNIQLINSGSEHVKLDKDSIDFSFSSPPYFSQEYYSVEKTQAYNNGEDYFYNIYWKQTLENVKFMLKPNKWFGLNILAKYTKMLEMAKEQFGEPVEIVQLRTVRSHLTKNINNSAEKFEPVYMFRNNK
jgi:hypothetical protein